MLRGGPLAERSVISLLNRRFVTFFFNVGRGQRGYDEDAAAFIAKVDERFAGRRVPTPPVWVFSPKGELVHTIDNYITKDAFLEQLKKVLRENPGYDEPTDDEKAVLDGALKAPRSAPAQLRAAELHEELAGFDQADTLFAKAARIDKTGETGFRAVLGSLRIARQAKDWKGSAALLQRASAWPGRLPQTYGDHIATERAHGLLAAGKHAEARQALVAAIKSHENSRRMGEMHFYAGVAAFHGEQRDWANFHWCWVMVNIPDDHHFMRCYLAATADAMPYPNPELGGYRGKSRMISHALADRARDAAMKDFERLKQDF